MGYMLERRGPKQGWPKNLGMNSIKVNHLGQPLLGASDKELFAYKRDRSGLLEGG